MSSSPGVTLEHTGVEACVSAGVFGEVVASHEAFVTKWAHETLFPRVCAKVSCQFIRAREFFCTARPGTLKGPLTGVNPEVRLQMGRLAVYFTTACIRAAVSFLRGCVQSVALPCPFNPARSLFALLPVLPILRITVHYSLGADAARYALV